jgi:hypothetical protein
LNKTAIYKIDSVLCNNNIMDLREVQDNLNTN